MIPSIAEHLVVMFVLLLPIALIEAFVISKRHLLKYRDSCVLSLRANWKSTVVGLPLGYFFAFLGVIPAGIFVTFLPKKIGSAIGVILFNALGHGGTAPNAFDAAGYYLGTLLVMVPYYLVTIRVEKKHIVKLRNDLDTPRLINTVRIMNAITYTLLAIPVAAGAVGTIVKLMK